jgi:hypothetical protein
MNKENKELLFKDLCGRLPYHVRVKVWLKDGTTEEGQLDLEHNYADVLLDAFYYDDIKDIKPYLRSMDSMTKEEKEELKQLGYEYFEEWTNAPTPIDKWKLDAKLCYNRSVFYNSHHLDWNGLIPMNLALEAPEGMYK